MPRRDAGSGKDQPNRLFIKMDKFAIFDLATRHRLGAVDAWILNVLTLRAEWETHEWRGTYGELAEDARVTRKTAKSACERLAAAGLIEIVESFGPNRSGRVRVLVYDEMVVPEARRSSRISIAQNSASPASPKRPPIAPDSRSIRAATAPPDAIDQGKQVGGRKRGSEVERVLQADAEQLCVTCDSEHVTTQAQGFYYCDACKPFSDDPDRRTPFAAEHERGVAVAEDGSLAARDERRRVAQLVELFDATIDDEYSTGSAA
jgi:hypothetical protein